MIRLKRRPIPWASLVAIALTWFLVESILIPSLGVSPTQFVYVTLRNGIEKGRVRVADAFMRAEDPGPAPDAPVVAAANGFGLRLLSEMTADTAGKNVFFSPTSVSTAMVMAWNGSAGHTRSVMAQALGLDGMALEEVNTAYQRIQAHLAATHPRIRVASAHGVWVDDRATLTPAFARRMEDSFGARAEALDLQAPDAPERINAWIRDKTKGRLDGVVRGFQPLDRIVLADVLTFHGTWTHYFKKGSTRPGPFHLLDGSEKTVPLMRQKATVGVLRDRDRAFTAARLPYADGSMAMYVFVPDRHDGLPAFLHALTPQRWDGWMGKFREVEFPIVLPRFRAEYEGELKDPLVRLGLGEAFDSAADFTAMGQAENGLSLGSVRHKARLEVDEAGTRAEAVTYEFMKARGRPLGLVANHPFFCAIRDERTGLLLFAGAIYDPEPLGS